MSAFGKLAKQGEKKSAIIQAIVDLRKKGETPTRKAVADYLHDTSSNLEYWFQLLKKEGFIDITVGGSGVPATISLIQKPEEKATADCPGCGRALRLCNCVNGSSEPQINQYVAPKTPGFMTGDPPPPPVNPCPNHPDREQRVGKNGKRLGVCDLCLKARPGVKNLEKGHQGRLVQVFFQDKHLDLKTWLDQEAESNERTIQQQIIFLLKQAKARTEPHVEKG